MIGSRLKGKVALVTGGAQGIGEAIARVFAEHGAAVIIADIQRDRGAALAAELGEHASYSFLDVCDIGQWEKLSAQSMQVHGGIDVLVNNAGGGDGGPIDRETPEQHRRILDLNVTGVWNGMRSILPAMDARGGGSIINISSIDGLAGVSGLSTYVSTKFAVTGMTKALALEFGGRGIRVNSIHPGIIETPLVRSSQIKSRLENAIARQPIQRMGKPEEIAYAALFFASDESTYCTGAGLVVDGGHLAGPYRDPM